MTGFKKHTAVLAIAVLVSFCGDGDKELNTMPVKTLQKITDATSFSNGIAAYNKKEGVIGIFNVPEMLVLSILDSAAVENVSAKMKRDYDRLQEDVDYTSAEINGPSGSINYTNKPNNFKFETVVCIRKIPSKQPRRSTIVILEASPMVVFNFYGSYQNLFAAYDKIKKYCKENKLLQSGPMREFYLTDPATEKDPKRWLTRIMVPVTPIKEED